MKLIARLLFFISGWKIKGTFPKDIKKCVLTGAPHTSNWDLVYGRAMIYLLDLKVRFLVKQEATKTLYGWLIKAMGGIPIDRSKSSNTVERMAAVFDDYDELVIGVSPEGTRKHNPNWKNGFYYIALTAKVPIAMGFVDFKNKEAGIGPILYPSGDIEKDIETMRVFYRGITGKIPEKGVFGY